MQLFVDLAVGAKRWTFGDKFYLIDHSYWKYISENV